MSGAPTKGDQVAVLDEGGRVLFYGTLGDDTPWLGWHRVTPDGDIHLPPKYKVIKREDSR